MKTKTTSIRVCTTRLLDLVSLNDIGHRVEQGSIRFLPHRESDNDPRTCMLGPQQHNTLGKVNTNTSTACFFNKTMPKSLNARSALTGERSGSTSRKGYVVKFRPSMRKVVCQASKRVFTRSPRPPFFLGRCRSQHVRLRPNFATMRHPAYFYNNCRFAVPPKSTIGCLPSRLLYNESTIRHWRHVLTPGGCLHLCCEKGSRILIPLVRNYAETCVLTNCWYRDNGKALERQILRNILGH